MKRYININQEQLLELCPNITLQEATVFDYLFYICATKNDKIVRIERNNEYFTWVDLASLLDNLPIMKLKSTSSISDIIKSIKDQKLIKTINLPQDGKNKLYIKLTDLTETLFATANGAIRPGERDHSPQRMYSNNIDSIYNNIYMSFKELINKESRLTDSAKTKIKLRLKSYSEEELRRAMTNFSNNQWWMEHNAGRGVAWFFHSDDRIDQFLSLNSTKVESGRSIIR